MRTLLSRVSVSMRRALAAAAAPMLAEEVTQAPRRLELHFRAQVRTGGSRTVRRMAPATSEWPSDSEPIGEAAMLERTYLVVAGLVGVGLLFFLLERVVPLRESKAQLVGRLLVNLALAALALAAATLVVRPAVEASFDRLADRPFGLAQWTALPVPAKGVLAFLLMDLSFYYWHLLNHRVPLLWRFHNVHHLDPDLDVSTALRFHFGELALSAGFRIVQILVIGVSPWAYAAYELVFQANTLFQHSNVRLPIRLERALNKLLVTPRMHGIHHSQVRREANSNYGVVFPWWDRLHRTLGLNVPQAALTIGVPGYSRPDDNRLWKAASLPFRRQRDYWRRPDGSLVGARGRGCG
jgi:sterol desaturase/sphingolipid hydroxylase (fatty acid hydroxylase superfamily)